jgi:hypothetical protein
LEQIVAKSFTVTTEKLSGLTIELGVVVPVGLLRVGVPTTSKYIEKIVAKEKTPA